MEPSFISQVVVTFSANEGTEMNCGNDTKGSSAISPGHLLSLPISKVSL